MPSKRHIASQKKKGLTKNPTTKKRLSAPVIQDLRILADQIGRIIPATSPNKRGGFCFKAIAQTLGLSKYWPKAEHSKKESIYEFLSKVYQNHSRLIYRVFRDNLARGIERRQKIGDPVLQTEIIDLDKTLLKLGINISTEIKALNLPSERPRIVPPPFTFQKMIDDLALHPVLQPECVSLFKNGHVNESVRKALEKYEAHIQRKAGLSNIGTDLMAHAFNEKVPKVAIADVSTKRGSGLQEGFKFLSMGSMSFWRNFCSHGDAEQVGHHDAIAVLAVISHLINYIDTDNTN